MSRGLHVHAQTISKQLFQFANGEHTKAPQS